MDTHVHIHKENGLLFPAGIRAEERFKAQGAERATAELEETNT